MARVPAAFPMAIRLPRGPGALIALVLATAAAPAAHAGPRTDCNAVNRGALNVGLDAAASDTRAVTLRSGEILKFTFRAESGPLGTLTLLEGPGSPRMLLAGPTGTTVDFAAARAGLFRFEFAGGGAKAASFTASCMPARSVRRAPASPSLLPSDSGAIGDSGAISEPLRLVKPDPAAVGIGAATLLEQGRGWVGDDAFTSLPTQAGGPEVKLQWRDQRYAVGGPEGPQIDANASGVEIGLNYTLQSAVLIGALAQFDPAGETLFGGQRSLSDHAWMAGPVATVNFAPGLVLSARAAWGSSENPPNDAAGSAAQRRLISAKLAKAHSFGAWRLSPVISFNHFEEMLPTPEPPSAGAMPAHTAAFGRIDVAPELAYRIDMAPSAFVEPRAVVGSFWKFDSLSELSPGAHLEPRLKAEAGVTFGIVDGPKLQASGAVEEGDAANPDVWSGRVQLSVPLK